VSMGSPGIAPRNSRMNLKNGFFLIQIPLVVRVRPGNVRNVMNVPDPLIPSLVHNPHLEADMFLLLAGMQEFDKIF
jgi:hypothetical protein